MNELSSLRNDIDRIDESIIDLLVKRQTTVKKIGTYKNTHGIAIIDMDHFAKVLESREASAQRKWLTRDYIRALWTIMHQEAITVQQTP